MAGMVKVEERVESSSEKRIRVFLFILFFIQTAMTTLPFVYGPYEDHFVTLSAVSMAIQLNGYGNMSAIALAIMGGLLVVLPMTAFFFCVLDKKRKWKYLVSALTSVVCAVIITFGIGPLISTGASISVGAIFTLVIDLITLFMTMMGLQATRIREMNSK